MTLQSSLDRRDRRKDLRQQGLVVLLAVVVGLWLLLPLADPRLLSPQIDEMIRLANARRIYDGGVPYRDYFDHAPPLCDLLLAGVYRVLGGPSLAASRAFSHALVVLAAVLLFAALRVERTRALPAALAALALPAALYLAFPVSVYHWVAAPFVAACWLFSALGARSTRWLFAAGIAAALAGLTVQTQGALAVAVALAFSLSRPHAPSAIAWLVTGGLLTTATVLGLLMLAGSDPAMLLQSTTFVVGGYRQSGGVNDMGFLADLPSRLPENSRLLRASVLALVALPFAGFAMAALLALGTRAQRVWLGPLALAALVFFVRPDFVHAAYYGLVPVALAVRLLDAHAGPARRVGLAVIAALVCFVSATQLVRPRIAGVETPPIFQRTPETDPVLAGLPALDATAVALDERLLFLRGYALAHPDHRILAAPLASGVYFFALPPATPVTLLFPASARYTREEEYRRVVDALRARPPELVLYSSAAAASDFVSPGADAPPSAHALAVLLRDGYAPWRSLGEAQLLRRLDLH